MKNENILKSSLDSLIQSKNNLRINTNNRNSDNDLSMSKKNVITDEEEQKYNRKTVKFTTNNIYSFKKYKIKTFHSPKVTKKKSSFNKITINSIKISENNENKKQKNFFKEPIYDKNTENLKVMDDLMLKDIDKNMIDHTNKTISNSSKPINYNLSESSKINKIVYPLLNSNHINDKCVSLDNNHKVKNKLSSNNTLFDEKNNSKTQTININKERINFQSNLFPTSINTTSYENTIWQNIHNKTDNNFYLEHKKKPKYYNIKLTKHHNNNFFTSIFKEYQKKMEPTFSLIKNKASNISKDIENNPFMRKIENLNDVNKFEIVFHKTIMNNITEIQKKKTSGFFRGKVCGINTNKNKANGNYISESKSNIFNITEMIDKMHPVSCLKFNKLLRKDYKEFLGNRNNFQKKKTKKEDKLRKVAIKRYHRELFFENEIADKYNIKKNQNIKFIEDEEVGIHKIQTDF